MSDFEITTQFQQELKRVREFYHYRSTKLSEDLKKGSSYISHVENGKIKRISSEMIENISKYITKKAHEDDSSDTTQYFEELLFGKFLLTLKDPCWSSTYYRRFLKIPIYEEELVTQLQEYLKEYDITPDELVKKVNEHTGNFDILYDINETIPKYIKLEPDYLDNILNQNKETSYDELFVLLYCLFKTNTDTTTAQTKAKDFLLTYYPTKAEVIVWLKEDSPDTYELLNSLDKFLMSGDDEENKRNQLTMETGAILAELTDAKETSQKGTGTIFIETLLRSLSHPDTGFVFGIFDNDYTAITKRGNRIEFVNELKKLIEKYSN